VGLGVLGRGEAKGGPRCSQSEVMEPGQAREKTRGGSDGGSQPVPRCRAHPRVPDRGGASARRHIFRPREKPGARERGVPAR
jgi:hypothetical protein